MAFKFKNMKKIINYLEKELGLNSYKINKVITDIEEIENNKTTNNDTTCSICACQYRLIECSYCEEKVCAACYNLCKECNKKLCDNCLSTYCPICFDLCGNYENKLIKRSVRDGDDSTYYFNICDLCGSYENKLIKHSVRGGDDSTYYFNICKDCNNLKDIKNKLEIKILNLN
jgi:hypothetical protein